MFAIDVGERRRGGLVHRVVEHRNRRIGAVRAVDRAEDTQVGHVGVGGLSALDVRHTATIVPVGVLVRELVEIRATDDLEVVGVARMGDGVVINGEVGLGHQ